MIGNVIFIFRDCFDHILPQDVFKLLLKLILETRHLEVLTKKGKPIFCKSE